MSVCLEQCDWLARLAGVVTVRGRIRFLCVLPIAPVRGHLAEVLCYRNRPIMCRIGELSYSAAVRKSSDVTAGELEQHSLMSMSQELISSLPVEIAL